MIDEADLQVVEPTDAESDIYAREARITLACWLLLGLGGLSALSGGAALVRGLSGDGAGTATFGAVALAWGGALLVVGRLADRRRPGARVLGVVLSVIGAVVGVALGLNAFYNGAGTGTPGLFAGLLLVLGYGAAGAVLARNHTAFR